MNDLLEIFSGGIYFSLSNMVLYSLSDIMYSKKNSKHIILNSTNFLYKYLVFKEKNHYFI